MSRNGGFGLAGGSFESQPGFKEALIRLDAFIKKIYKGERPGEEPADRVRFYLRMKYGDRAENATLQRFLELGREGAAQMDEAILAPILDEVKRDSFFGQTGVKWALPEVRALLYRLYELLYP